MDRVQMGREVLVSIARFAAHPLVVAVALGLLGAHAIDAESEEDTVRDGGGDATPDVVPTDASDRFEVRSIDAAELARVEQEWLAARDLIV